MRRSAVIASRLAPLFAPRGLQYFFIQDDRCALGGGYVPYEMISIPLKKSTRPANPVLRIVYFLCGPVMKFPLERNVRKHLECASQAPSILRVPRLDWLVVASS